jgi:hypothetical protein
MFHVEHFSDESHVPRGTWHLGETNKASAIARQDHLEPRMIPRDRIPEVDLILVCYPSTMFHVEHLPVVHPLN